LHWESELGVYIYRKHIPERITDDEKDDVLGLCVSQDLVCMVLDEIAIGYDEWTTIERLETIVVNQQDGCVSFEIDTRCRSNSIETTDRDVQFVAETESDEVEHFMVRLSEINIVGFALQ
jgi:hypothetical protein